MDNDGDYYEKNYVLEFSEFHGCATDNVEFFLRDFEAIAQYNEQSTDEDKLRILPGLFKSRALAWYKSLPAEATRDWKKFCAAFVKQFRRNPHNLLTKLSRIKKKPEETIRKYSIRVTKLINKLQCLDEPYPERVKVWWYLKGLPTIVRKYCLQADYTTLETAISTAKIYESTTRSSREEVHGKAHDWGVDDADQQSDYSDVESCTSMGTFVSSVAESVDLKARKIAQRRVFSSPGLQRKVESPGEKKIGTWKDRPLTGVSRSDQKPSKNMTVPIADSKYGKKPPSTPTTQKCQNERLLAMKMKEPFHAQRRK